MINKRLWATALASTSLITPIAAFAADTPAEEIKITATRTPILLSESAAQVTVLTAADLERAQFQTVADALKTVVGLSVSQSGSVGGQTQIRPRGAEANHLLVMIDGVKINDPAAGDEVQWELFSTLAIERIEIIKTPLSASWGRGALGGVINIITKSAEKDQINLSVEGGSLDTKRLSGTYTTRGEGWHMLASVAYQKSDGVNAARTGNEKDGFENLTAHLKTGVKLGDHHDLMLSVRHSSSDTDYDSTDFMTGLPVDADLTTENKMTNIAAILDSHMNDHLTLKTRLGFLNTDISNFNTGAANGSTSADKYTAALDAIISLTAGHKITLGTDYEKTDFNQTGTATTFGNPNQSQDFETFGLTAEGVLKLSPNTSVTGSIRQDWHSDFDDFTSWRVGGSMQLTPHIRAFSSVSRGQKAPTFIERFGFFPDQFLGNPDIKPEKSLSYEAGVDIKLSDRLTAQITAYRANLKNEIDGFAFDSDTFMFTAQNEDGKSTRKGIEVMTQWQASDTASLSLSYSYLSAREQDGTGGTQRELRRPRHQATASGDFQLTPKLSLSAQATYTGKADDLFFPPWPNPSERVTLKDYLLVRLNATFKLTEQISLYTRIENGLNEDYEDVFGFNTQGRVAFFGLKGQF